MKPLVKLAVLAAVLAALAAMALAMKRSDVYLITLYAVYLMATFGLNLTVGYAGQMSLGQAAFFGIGAYLAAILLKLGWPFHLVLLVAAAVCFVLGLALGFPALRVQHHYLAFATLGFNVLVYLAMRNEEKITGGTFGISGIPRPTILGVDLSGHVAYYWFTLASLVVLGFLLWWLLRSPWGRAFAALRDNPIRAESLGVNIQAYTLLSFAIGAVYAGIAGALFASLVQFIEPAPFTVGASIMMYLMVVVGGPGYFFGPLLGSAVGVLLPEWLRFAQAWYLFVFGVAVILLMLWLPDGLLSIPERLRAKRLAREASAARAAAAARAGASA
jgi:branched-chain amino acid transport system permease protein